MTKDKVCKNKEVAPKLCSTSSNATGY